MKKLFFIPLLFFISNNVLSQKKGYSDGYIVTKENDTIYGFVKNKQGTSSHKLVNFLDSVGKKTKYRAYELKAYTKNNTVFRSFKTSGRMVDLRVFLLLKNSGNVNLYEYNEIVTSYSGGQNGGSMTSYNRKSYFG